MPPPQVFYGRVTGEGLGVDAEGGRRGRGETLLCCHCCSCLGTSHVPALLLLVFGFALFDGQDTFQHPYNLYSTPAQPLEVLTTGKGLLLKYLPYSDSTSS